MPDNGAYKWQVGLDLVPGSDYSIQISSAAKGALFGGSDLPFSIDVPRITSIQAEPGWSLGAELDWHVGQRVCRV